MQTSVAGFVLSALLLFSGNTALSAQNRDAKANDTRPVSSRAQANLEREVYHQLVTLPFYSVFDNLSFQVQGYRVTLSGQTVSDTLKHDAETHVKSIEGVESVVNNIQLLPASQNDDRIRRAVYQAIYGDSSLSRYAVRAVPPIHIIVNGGHLTLEGAVGSEMDKVVANTRANGVSGVFSVTNNLRVDRN